MDTNRSILRSAKSFFAGTALSRLSGMAREIAMAFCFGATPEIAAFMVAYRLANLFRRLLGEGNLQAGFVPHYEAAKSEGRAAIFYRDASFSFSIVFIGAIAVLESVLLIAKPYAEPGWREILELSMWMLPGLFFICLYGLNSSLLQCEKRYFLPGSAPVFFNAVWIGAAFWAYQMPQERAMRWMAAGVSGAFFIQWLCTSLAVRRILGSSSSPPKVFTQEWKKLLKPMVLGIIGISAVQLNTALDAIFARMADPSGPAFLWYAIRIEQLPLALFGIALSGALLPPLARAMREGAFERYRELLQSALRSSAALMIPCTFGILALGGAGVNLLYGRGDFSSTDVVETLHCLWGYGLGLVPSVFVLLLAAGFYAQKSYRIPTIASLISVAVNISLNALFVLGFGWGALSVALATSLSAYVNAAILGRALPWAFLAKMTLCSALPAVVTILIDHTWVQGEFPRGFANQVLHLGVLSAIYCTGLAILIWRMRLWELFQREKQALP